MRRQALTVLLALALVVPCGPGPVCADELVLKNGERLIGTLHIMEAGTITFTSDMLGELKIPLENVTRLSTDAGVAMHLSSGDVIQAFSMAVDNNTVTLGPAEEPSPLVVPLQSISAINPPVTPKVTYTGSITAGLTDSHGNTSSLKGNLDASLTIRSERQRLRLQALYIYGREDNPDKRQPGARDTIETDKNFTAIAQYDYFFTKKIYGYLNTTYKKDPVADLEYRLIHSTGLGYQWIETPALKFSTNAGVAWYREKYDTRIDNPLYGVEADQPRFLKDTTRQNSGAWQAGMNFDWRANSLLALLANAQYTESLVDRNDYFLRAEGEARLLFTEAFYSSFKALFEYDNTPGPGSSSTETKYIIGVGWSY